MDVKINRAEELDAYLEYLARNDSYTIRDITGHYFCVNGEPEAYRRWGKSHIYVGYHGTSVIRMEPHIIPCEQHISSYCQSEWCPEFDRIAIHRLVAECWHDNYCRDSVIRKKNTGYQYPNAANNLYIHPTYHNPDPRTRNPMDYDYLSGKIELV